MHWTDELDDDDFLYFDIFHFSRPDTYSPESQEGIIGSDLN